MSMSRDQLLELLKTAARIAQTHDNEDKNLYGASVDGWMSFEVVPHHIRARAPGVTFPNWRDVFEALCDVTLTD